MKCDKFNDFYEHEHGYVFNRQQLEQIINEIRQEVFQECVDECNKLADLTAKSPTGDEYKHVYVFAMNRIRDIMFNDNINNVE